MEIEVFEAFRSAGVPDDKARAVVDSINRIIDQRFRELFSEHGYPPANAVLNVRGTGAEGRDGTSEV